MGLYGYSISEASATDFITRCRELIDTKDVASWKKLAATFSRLYPRVLIRARTAETTLSGPPLAQASHYRPELSDLKESEVPEWNDETLQWLLMNLLLQVAAHRAYITFDHFYFALDDAPFRQLAGPEAKAELDLLLASVLAPRHLPPPALSCLSTASHVHSYCAADAVQAVVSMENESRSLGRAVARLLNQGHFVSTHLGEDLSRLLRFLEVAAHEKVGVFMTPYPVEL